ncbi:hypothetical protein Rhe02_15990 [Rhizocola hellebori]|uniref:Zinc finger CGNR domain-containing protein n=1 Tax=Rhizocola hellebori TaxID=1392758 RepID=A0A8J3Q569_9ACTN|nr:CGNR zinc finger domain-containing protein [Rhizocola hellebori]GIH03532.1 hypothetical protein Rhe02_15990 [Rhizocola hellebori]
MDNPLALSLVSTIRHDGNGGVADDLPGPAELTAWVRSHETDLGPWAAGFVAKDRVWREIIALRQAVRTLFYHAAGRPNDPRDPALILINDTASRVPPKRILQWAPGTEPTVKAVVPQEDLPAALAQAAIDFLGGPLSRELRACPAPRCVRFFVREHGRQEFCKPSCSNRARAARHYEKHAGTR